MQYPEEKRIFGSPCSSGKKWFPDELSAWALAAVIELNHPGRLLACYECPICFGWHHTHRYAEARRRDRERKVRIMTEVLLRRGRAIVEHIDHIVRLLFQSGVRVVGISIRDTDMLAFSKFCQECVPGNVLNGHGYQHPEIGYIPVRQFRTDDNPAVPAYTPIVFYAASGKLYFTERTNNDYRTWWSSALVAELQGFGTTPEIPEITYEQPGEESETETEDIETGGEAAPEIGETGTPVVDASDAVSGVPAEDDAQPAPVSGSASNEDAAEPQPDEAGADGSQTGDDEQAGVSGSAVIPTIDLK